MLADPSPAVRIAAASRTGGVEVLIEALKDKEDSVRLMAAIALGQMGDKARPAGGLLREIAPEPGRNCPSRVARHILAGWR